MIKTTIDQYDEKLKNKAITKYQQEHNIPKIRKHYGLSRNEILALLLASGIRDYELRKDLPHFHFFSDSFIVISDTHFGSKLENEEYLKVVYDFAIKFGIKHIIHAGDLMQSTMRPVMGKYVNLEEQANHILDIYPESEHITNHILLGNHDFHAIKREEKIFKILSSRKDFDILGFKKAYFSWNNHLMSITHDVDKYHLHIPNIDSLLRLAGHRHSLKVVGDSTIFCPTLGDDLKYYGGSSQPGFLLVVKENSLMKVLYLTIDLESKSKTHDEGIVLSKKMTKKYRK